MNHEDLFLWAPDHRSKYARVRRVDDADGTKGITLFAGRPTYYRRLTVWVGEGQLADFLDDPGLRLIVSDRTRRTLQKWTSVQLIPTDLCRPGSPPETDRVWWMNPLSTFDLMDEARSKYNLLIPRVFDRIEHFEVDHAKVPEEHVFVCGELGLPVFSRAAVDAIQDAGLTGAVFTRLQGSRWP